MNIMELQTRLQRFNEREIHSDREDKYIIVRDEDAKDCGGCFYGIDCSYRCHDEPSKECFHDQVYFKWEDEYSDFYGHSHVIETNDQEMKDSF